MPLELIFIALFSTATAVALVARWLKIPYTVALVVAGLALGSTRTFTPPHLTKDLLYAVFLPGLLFEAAFHLEFRRFWQNKLAITALAIPGVVVAIGITAAVLTPVANAVHFVSDFRFVYGLVFAAMIAATDPIAVVALFKSLGAPKRLTLLIEGESLLNDGTAVILFTLIVGFVTGRHMSASDAVFDFVRVIGVGIAIGSALGFIASRLTAKIEDPMIEITLTTLAAYGSFVAAEQLHYSGVIATVSAGMLCGNYGAKIGMSPSTRIAVESFWEYVAFALNSVVFLLIGFEVRLPALLASWRPILVAYLAVTLGRAVVIALVTAALHRSRERVPSRWAAVLGWGGLRGALSMVLALGLPATFPHRELLVTMTFGVVIISILVQGLTMRPLLRRLGLASIDTGQTEHEMQRATAIAANAALAALEDMVREGSVHADVTRDLRQRYSEQASAAQERMRELHVSNADVTAEELLAAERQLLLVEKDAVREARRKGSIGEATAAQILGDIDARFIKLEGREH